MPLFKYTWSIGVISEHRCLIITSDIRHGCSEIIPQVIVYFISFSVVDAFDPDLTKYPRFKKAVSIVFEQLPGEILFIPSGWFHQVHTASRKTVIFYIECDIYHENITVLPQICCLLIINSCLKSVFFTDFKMLLIFTSYIVQAYNSEETLAISSQVMNRNNYRVVLEEILKVGDIQRDSLPSDIDLMSPEQQVAMHDIAKLSVHQI